MNIKPIRVAALEHRGTPETLEESIAIFRAWRQASGCSPIAVKRTFGVPLSNPEKIPAEAFRFAICAEVDADIADNDAGVQCREIMGGRYAKLRHKGSMQSLNRQVDVMLRNWLPTTEESKRESPMFFEYLNITAENSEADAITDIYLPLK